MDQAPAVEAARIEELLSSYRELQDQFDQVRERLRRAEDHRHTVARRIYDRVRSDYDRELDAIRLRLTPLRDELERVQESLEVQYRDATAALQSVEEELSEADFRHRIGEYPDPTFDEMKRALDAHAEDARTRQGSLQAALSAIAAMRSPENTDASIEDTVADTATAEAAPVAPEIPTEIPSLGADPANDTEAFTDDPFAVSHDEAIMSDDLSAIVVDEPPSLGNTDESAAAEPESLPPPEPVPMLEAETADAVESEPAEVRNAEAEPQATSTALINAFENPQRWVNEMTPDTVRAERRVRLSQPTPPVAPARAKQSVQEEIDSVLSPLEAGAKATGRVQTPARATTTASSPSTLPSLVFVSGPHTGQAIALLPTTLTIGREHDNNVEIKDPDVARYHARILRERDDFVVEDLNSSSGTWINGERKTKAVLSHGDVIRVGQTELALDFEWTTDSR
jgi:hypothetical protein